MRFGGHETFAIREGWLHKGLKLLTSDPDLFHDEYVADWLGVGCNMAKSIKHWLLATGLAQVGGTLQSRNTLGIEPTPLGKLIYDKDPYFTDIGTWWTLHVNLVHSASFAATWSSFFNRFNLNRFERAVCIESVRRDLEMSMRRILTPRTLERDVGCLLSTYVRTIPAEREDPEEGKFCPFRDLGLLTYYRTSGYYELNRAPKLVPAEVFGYALAKFAAAGVGNRTGPVDITFQSAAYDAGGPGRVFVLTSESLFETVLSLERDSRDIEIAGSAGERLIRFARKAALCWVKDYYRESIRGKTNGA